MGAQRAYLYTSAAVERYVTEEGSSRVDALYREAHAGNLMIGFSVWNIGEVAVVLDKYEKRGVIGDAREVFASFIGETRLLARLSQLSLVSLKYDVLASTIGYVFKHGIYIADAVQFASARGFDAFLTYDKRLARLAEVEGLKLYPG
ncbi:type II toxin-antitoxin system VapC family toxin [Infirmifilum sp. SLHALR2]|nr:MAG: hypothetical protein B7L53_01830 [Thermofilum sp. NZ13]